MNRLWVRLTLAFALVVLLTVGTIALLADLTAGQAFRQYLSYSDIARFQNLTDNLVEYYQTQGSWDGIEAILDQVRIVSGAMPAPMMGRRPDTLAWRDERFQITLANAGGRVVYDVPDGQPGRKLTVGERAAAQDLLVEDEVVGRLVISRPVQSAILGPLERVFVNRLRWLLVGGALLAGALGVLLESAVEAPDDGAGRQSGIDYDTHVVLLFDWGPVCAGSFVTQIPRLRDAYSL